MALRVRLFHGFLAATLLCLMLPPSTSADGQALTVDVQSRPRAGETLQQAPCARRPRGTLHAAGVGEMELDLRATAGYGTGRRLRVDHGPHARRGLAGRRANAAAPVAYNRWQVATYRRAGRATEVG